MTDATAPFWACEHTYNNRRSRAPLALTAAVPSRPSRGLARSIPSETALTSPPQSDSPSVSLKLRFGVMAVRRFTYKTAPGHADPPLLLLLAAHACASLSLV